MKPILIIVGHEHGIISALHSIRNPPELIKVAEDHEETLMHQQQFKIEYTMKKQAANIESMLNELRYTAMSSVFPVKTLNQRQKRKQWRQSPHSRPCRNKM